MAKLNFQQQLFQSSVSHDSSEIILICWFLTCFIIIVINVESCFASVCILSKLLYVYVSIFLWIESSKEQHLFKVEIF